MSAGPFSFSELQRIETAALKIRREKAHLPPNGGLAPIGLALSGGGQRSATFCLGIVQALAKKGLLRGIDYLSSVSGGGYTGTMIGGFFARDDQSLRPPAAPRPGTGDRHDLLEERMRIGSVWIRWLRDNGGYLAPNGGADLIVAAGVWVRNALSLYLLIGMFLLWWGLLASLLPILGVFLLKEVGAGLHPVWWGIGSLAAACGALAILSRSAWTTREPAERWTGGLAVVACLILGAGGAGVLLCGILEHLECSPCLQWHTYRLDLNLSRHHLFPGWLNFPHGVWLSPYLGFSVLVFLASFGLFGLLFWTVGQREKTNKSPGEARYAKLAFVPLPLTVRETRDALTKAFAAGALVSFLLFAAGLIDSLGMSLYVYLVQNPLHLGIAWKIGAALGSFAAAIPSLRGLLGIVGQKHQDERLSLPASVLAALAAGILVASIFTLASMATHAIEWRRHVPPSREAAWQQLQQSPWTRDSFFGIPLAALAVLTVARFWAGRNMDFLNQSTYQSLYAARLTRAFLGVSNEVQRNFEDVTDVFSEDDILFEKYRPHLRGGPIHLVNVTLNETVDGKTNADQRGRKGIGMCVGPAGVSVGVRHHAQWSPPGPVSPGAPWQPGTLDSLALPDGYPVFPGSRKKIPCESLRVGQWMGISGAAFSTGMGIKTSLSLSLLCGLSNLRLGYWWDSGINPLQRQGVGINSWHFLSAIYDRIFPLQAHLLDEFFARFLGPQRQCWYLSDGGHFENTAVYELVRRGTPFVIAIDCGADPDYIFEDVANLARKIRQDFQGELKFLDAPGIAAELASNACLQAWLGSGPAPRADRLGIGTLDDLRRGTVRGGCFSNAHATLARITYPHHAPAEGDKRADTLLLWIKPTVTGKEPVDILQYHEGHASFPQEPTTEQFFDDAQWESYRALGEHIGNTVFQDASPMRKPTPSASA